MNFFIKLEGNLYYGLNDLFEVKIRNRYKNHATTIIEDNGDTKNAKEVFYNNYQLNRLDNNLENGNNIIKKIGINKLCIYYCFCFVNHNKNINNILYDEGMKLIYEQLDIFNIFRRLFEVSKRENMITKEDIKTQMSDECKQKVENIINKNLFI